MHARILQLSFFVLCLLLAAPDTLALSCIKPAHHNRLTAAQQLERRMAQFAIVFAGIPMESHRDGAAQTTTFRVLRVFKGSVTRTVAAAEGLAFSEPTTYSAGKVYVVFAWRIDGTLYSTNDCDDLIELAPRGGRPNYPDGLGEGWRPH